MCTHALPCICISVVCINLCTVFLTWLLCVHTHAFNYVVPLVNYWHIPHLFVALCRRSKTKSQRAVLENTVGACVFLTYIHTFHNHLHEDSKGNTVHGHIQRRAFHFSVTRCTVSMHATPFPHMETLMLESRVMD